MNLAEKIAAAQDWWREAGVDQHFLDEAVCLLAEPEERARPGAVPATDATALAPEKPAPVLPNIGGDRESWPGDLATFRQWWLEEPALGENGSYARVAPVGEANAKLLVLVAMPEAEDGAALLSGAHGRLIANMARAMGFSPDELYLASALPRHMPMPDWQGLRESGLGALTQHHIALARPQRCLVMGRDLHNLLAGNDAPPTLNTYSPDSLLTNARLRADLWRRWLDWEHSPR